MTKVRRLGSVILALVLVFSLVLAACSKENNEPASENDPPKASVGDDENNEEGSKDEGILILPISKEKMNLSLWAPMDGNFKGKNYNEKASFQQMEKNTNIHIDFKSGQGDEAFGLLMSSGKLPDMIFHYYWDKEGGKYGEIGALLALEELIDEHAPNLKRILSENPEVKGQITSPDGNIYYLPNIELNPTGWIQMFPQIRADWLEKLKLEQPKTIDDWYTVLKAFREGDPNGNKVKDEVPLVTAGILNVMRLFAPAYGMEYDFFVDNGMVQYGPYEPEFKDVVTFLNKLYSEELFDPNYLVDGTFKSLTEKVTTDRAGAWFGWSGSYMGNFTKLMEGKHDTFKIAPVLPPIGPDGDQRHVSNRWPATGVGIAVAADTKNAEEVIKWLDYQYSTDGIILNNFGVEGVSYDLVNGEPVFKDVILHPTQEGFNNTQALLNYTIGGGSWATVGDPRYLEQIRIANGQLENPLELYGKYVDFDKKIPPLQFLPKENDIILPIMADVTTFVDENINAFIMGRRSLTEYDAFIAQLKNMKFDRVLEQYQKAYDRFKGK